MYTPIMRRQPASGIIDKLNVSLLLDVNLAGKGPLEILAAPQLHNNVWERGESAAMVEGAQSKPSRSWICICK